jgi:hypothetical protein
MGYAKNKNNSKENGGFGLTWLKLNPNYEDGSKKPVRTGFTVITPEILRQLNEDAEVDDNGNRKLEIALWVDSYNEGVIKGQAQVIINEGL